MIGVTQDKKERVREEKRMEDPRAGDLRWIGWRRSEKKGASESVCTTRDQKLKGNEWLWCEPFYSGQLTTALPLRTAQQLRRARERPRASRGATSTLTALGIDLSPPRPVCLGDQLTGHLVKYALTRT